MYNKVKNKEEIEAIRESGRILSTILNEITRTVRAGMTGLDVDTLSRSLLQKYDATPAFLGYQGFPSSICISVNDAVVHGIPNNTPFKEGDIVGFDFGVLYNGMITDAARTVIIGNAPKKEHTLLLERTRRALDEGIQAARSGAHVGDISFAVESYISQFGYGNVRDLVGHGVGHAVHEGPEVPNYGVSGQGPILKSGMTIAIEPMITLGMHHVVVDPDGWTIRTRDGSLSAHFEDTILITDDGAEILTRI